MKEPAKNASKVARAPGAGDLLQVRRGFRQVFALPEASAAHVPIYLLRHGVCDPCVFWLSGERGILQDGVIDLTKADGPRVGCGHSVP